MKKGLRHNTFAALGGPVLSEPSPDEEGIKTLIGRALIGDRQSEPSPDEEGIKTRNSERRR